MDEINYDDFSKIDFRVGEIKSAEEVEGSDKLIKMKVDFGDLGEKQVFSGIRKWYKSEDLIGKKTVFVVNLPVRLIMGQDSEAMIFTAEEDDSKDVSVIILDREVKNGSRVY